MRLRLLGVPLLLAILHCGGAVDPTDPGPTPTPTPAPDNPPSGDGGTMVPNHDATGATTSTKVDLLLVVDNSASMSEKASALSASIGTLINGVASSNDLHIGVIDTSLGTFGGDICPDSSAGANSLSHLHSPGGGADFLTYDGSGGDALAKTIADTQSLVQGVGQTGCGLEAQLESAYRFLVEPNPWQSVSLVNSIASLDGTDTLLLQQRARFLREDSLVVVVMLTDEDDSATDPLSVGGQGWAFSNTTFPGSTQLRPDGVGTTAPRATSACATNPGSEDCTSCGFAPTCDRSEPACQKINADPNCQMTNGYYSSSEDAINVRFQNMKQRFGIDPQYPVERYSDGFTKALVPDRDAAHPRVGNTVAAYTNAANCTNPLFASHLPTAAGDELCNLATGPRGKDLVVLAVIGGVPSTLATASPDWTTVVGADPASYDQSGKDVHMLQSVTARAGLPPPSSTLGDNGTDPISGREWDTQGDDLQYACTFALPTAEPFVPNGFSDCEGPANPPLCAPDRSQIRGKAYPTIRELRVAQALGDRGVIGSICPTDATLGYVSTMQTLADRLAPRLILKK